MQIRQSSEKIEKIKFSFWNSNSQNKKFLRVISLLLGQGITELWQWQPTFNIFFCIFKIKVKNDLKSKFGYFDLFNDPFLGLLNFIIITSIFDPISFCILKPRGLRQRGS